MEQIKKYKDAKDFLFNQLPMFQRIGPKAFKKDLKNIEALSAYLGHPHEQFESLHIAGTNGKGSTAHFLASILMASGYKVGLYTSPHYKDYRERIKINGKKISKSYVKAFLNRLIQDKVLDQELKPSFFEITVGMAFQYFADQAVDIAIIETGLGGRLDSTNIIHPRLSLITNIGLDHTQFLGDTLEKIAVEKAGIIKKEIPVIIGEKQKNTTGIFNDKARENKAPIFYAEELISVICLKKSMEGNTYQIEFKNQSCLIKTKLGGSFQEHNIKLAVLAADMYINSKTAHELDLSILQIALTKGIREMGYMGRFQWLKGDQKILLDSAHNEDGLNKLIQEIQELSFDQLHIVYGAVNDKSLDKILAILPKRAQYYFCAAKIPRAKKVVDLVEEAKFHDLKGDGYKSVRKALKVAKKEAGKSDLILVAGSIFVIAEVL